MRGGKTSNVLLEEVLRRQLRELNSIRVGSRKEERFSEQNIENGVIAMRNVPMEGGYLSGNEAVYNMLTLGKAFEQSIDGAAAIMQFCMGVTRSLYWPMAAQAVSGAYEESS